jgi:hypothetical protein
MVRVLNDNATQAADGENDGGAVAPAAPTETAATAGAQPLRPKIRASGSSTSRDNATATDTTPSSNSEADKRRSSPSRGAEPSKTDLVLKKLRLARGVTIAQITEVTGWQPHSVRGFLSAVVRKKLGLNLASETGKDGQRRYRLIDGDARQVG